MKTLIRVIILLISQINLIFADIVLELPKETDAEHSKLSASWINHNKNIDLTGHEFTKGAFAARKLDYAKDAGDFKVVLDDPEEEAKNDVAMQLTIQKEKETINFPQISIKIGNEPTQIAPHSKHRLLYEEKCQQNEIEEVKAADGKYSLCMQNEYK